MPNPTPLHQLRSDCTVLLLSGVLITWCHRQNSNITLDNFRYKSFIDNKKERTSARIVNSYEGILFHGQFRSHLGTCPPGNFCKLARYTEIEFCVNFDHINSLADKLSNIFTFKKELIQIIHYHDFLHWPCCYSSSLSSDLAHY